MPRSLRARRGVAYHLVKSAYATTLRARSWIPRARPLDNLYLATVQKTGSQWLRAILADPEIRSRSGLLAYPQRRYEWGEFVRTFPIGTFVPGLYVSYDLYQEIRKPRRYRTIYVMRDPRDIVVSWYWSMLSSHVVMGKVGAYRADLQERDVDSGLHYAIDALTMKFAQMRTWALNADDPAVHVMRFEVMTAQPEASLRELFDAIGIPFSDDQVHDLAQRYSKDRMRERDLRHRDASEGSHYRRQSSRHREAFRDDHHDHFRAVAGDLASQLGYDD